jgi:hypothetical protein
MENVCKRPNDFLMSRWISFRDVNRVNMSEFSSSRQLSGWVRVQILDIRNRSCNLLATFSFMSVLYDKRINWLWARQIRLYLC